MRAALKFAGLLCCCAAAALEELVVEATDSEMKDALGGEEEGCWCETGSMSQQLQ